MSNSENALAQMQFLTGSPRAIEFKASEELHVVDTLATSTLVKKFW